MRSNYSLHQIAEEDNFGFSADDYSRFKFGDAVVAKYFGEDLAKGFIKDVLSSLDEVGQLVVLPSPYAFIPTATFPLKNHFIYTLNQWLAENGHPVAEETKVHRTTTYREDYGELDAAQRMNLISNDSFHIDKEFIKGKRLVFIDDIKITGGHERMILKMVKEYSLENDIHLLYYAELVNPNIHPRIENHLNYHCVKSIFDLQDIINGPAFSVNTRMVKYVLNYEFDAFKVFMENQTPEICLLLFNMAIGNNYHLIEAYKRNLDYMKTNFISTNHKKTIEHGN